MVHLPEILEKLATKRPIFHSEADFQHALAWELHEALPEARVRLEVPVRGEQRAIHIDLVIAIGNAVTAVELKYLTRGISMTLDGEPYNLADQSAQDISRYDCIKDICRLEGIVASGRAVAGYAVVLTNDSAYWKVAANSNTVDAEFRLHDGRTLEGELRWSTKAGTGTTKGREQPLSLRGKHALKWHDYSTIAAASYGKFRYLVLATQP
jgi:hypothetical protein